MKLNNTAIDSILATGKPGRYSDGSGLYFVKGKTGTGYWVLMYRREGKLREMGLGSYSAVARVTLKQARQNALVARVKLGAGEDPLAEKKLNAPAALFEAMMKAKIEAKMVEWGRTAEKNRKDWTSTLTNHAAKLMTVPVGKIDTAMVLDVLKPIWTEKAETADRVRERIAQVLDFARDKGLRQGDNPAAKGTLKNLLGAQKAKGVEEENHVAMDRAMIQPWWAQLQAIEGLAARALELIVLTGARLSEVREMVWTEVDLDEGKWTIPANRMKAGKKHVVTLSDQAIELLSALPRFEGSKYVFANPETGLPFAPATIRRLFRSMGVTEEQADVHGFRSAFVSWVRDETTFDETLAQVAIAHAVGGKVERVYQKGQALAKRAVMLQAWADWLDGKSANKIVALAA